MFSEVRLDFLRKCWFPAGMLSCVGAKSCCRLRNDWHGLHNFLCLVGTGSVGWDAKESVDFSGNFSNLRMKQMTGGILDYGSTQTDLSVLFLQ